MAERIHEYVSPQRRGVIALPASLRERLRLDEPGAQLEFLESESGEIVVRGVLPVPADQSWFWSPEWQAMERKADEDVAAGRVERHGSVDELLGSLDG